MFIIRWELSRLIHIREFMLTAGLLFVLSAGTIVWQEQGTNAFRALFLHQDENAYILAENERQSEYVSEYDRFLDTVRQQSTWTKDNTQEEERKSFAYRNAVKTLHDYSKINENLVSQRNQIGWNQYVAYDYGFFFVLAFGMAVTYFLVLRERRSGRAVLTSSACRGRTMLAAAQIGAAAVFALLYTLAEESFSLIMYSLFYGPLDFSVSAQSIPALRDFSGTLTMGECVALQSLVRAGLSFVCFILIWGICSAFSGMWQVILIIGAVSAGQVYVSSQIQLTGRYAALRILSLFRFWRFGGSMGTYRNLDIAGFPVSKNICMAVVWLTATAMTGTFGVIRSGSNVCGRTAGFRIGTEQVLKKLSRMYHTSALTGFELAKSLFIHRRILVVCALAILTVFQIREIRKERVYPTNEEAAYHLYVSRMEGKVSERTLAQCEAARNEQTERMNAAAMAEDPDQADYYMMEYDLYERGLEDVEAQVAFLEERGNLYSKYVVDEKEYAGIWKNPVQNASAFLCAAATVLLMTSCIVSPDLQSGMELLLRSTRYGRKKLRHARGIATAILTLISAVQYAVVLMARYWQIDGMTCGGQKISDFYIFGGSGSSLSIVQVMVGTIILAAFFLYLLALLEIWIQKHIKSELVCIALPLLLTAAVLTAACRSGFTVESLLLGVRL